MNSSNEIPTGRIEAFSDGVIAIIITVMVFDLKLQGVPTDKNVWNEMMAILPKFISYVMSFLMLAIMWVNHHQLFHQIHHTDRPLLWYSIHLLFWMSLIPFVTNFIGANVLLWQASAFYGLVFAMCAWSFAILRGYVISHHLLHATISMDAQLRIKNKNRLSIAIYLAAAMLSTVSVYISFGLFLVVPAMYFIPENIVHLKTNEE
ncbi:MAG: TMEM175 family protein [Cyclobacteriaceae bacterium]|nr:TMEM175 family protein [Cyclobacteriaceae bacterium]